MHDCAEALPELLSLNEIAKSGETLSIKQINQACARYEDKMLDRAFAWVKKSGGTSIAVSTLYLISIGPGIDRHRAPTWMVSLVMRLDGLTV